MTGNPNPDGNTAGPVAGPMAGQPPYTPFENDRLKWKRATSEVSGPVLAKREPEALETRRPAILLFVANRDNGNCCAANYERFIFRDQKVVKLAEKKFVVVRIDRASAPEDMLKRYGVIQKRPTLMITDCEGETFHRWDLCASANKVYAAMVRCLKASRKKEKVVVKQQVMFDDVQVLLNQKSYRGASTLLRKILRTKGGFKAADVRARRMWGELEATGKELFGQAQDWPLTERYDELLSLRTEFWFFDDLAETIRDTISELENGEETADKIHAYKGTKLVAEAESLIDRGKTAKGRTILRKVRREYAGTPAATKAAKLLD